MQPTQYSTHISTHITAHILQNTHHNTHIAAHMLQSAGPTALTLLMDPELWFRNSTYVFVEVIHEIVCQQNVQAFSPLSTWVACPVPSSTGEWSWRKIRSCHNPILLCRQLSGDVPLMFTLFLDAKRKNKSEPPFFTLRIVEAILPHFCVQVALFDEVCRVPRPQKASHGHTALFILHFLNG